MKRHSPSVRSITLRAVIAAVFTVLVSGSVSGPAQAGPSKSELQALKAHPYYGHDIIVMIDKALQGSSMNAQRLRLYQYDRTAKELTFVARWRISTGAESPKENAQGNVRPRTTLKGYYRPQVLDPDAYSRSWDGPMVFSLFYDHPRYAIHGTESYNYFKLGRRASGGCTRLTATNANKLYTMVDQLGKGWTFQVNRYTGRPVRSASGGYVTSWSYRALILIEEDGEMEPTHTGFMHRDVVFNSPSSGATHVNIPQQWTPPITISSLEK